MKHLLNNISEEEKNRIREQHEGGMNLSIDNFKKLVETKLGDAKPYLTEASQETCEQCGGEMREGECVEQCGSMKEEELDEQNSPVGNLKDDEVEVLAKKIVDCLDGNDEMKKLLFRLNLDSKMYRTFFDKAMIEMGDYINSFGPKGPLG